MSVHSCIPVIQPNKNQFHEFMDGYFYFGKTRYIVTANRGNGVLELKKTELKSVICQTILKVVSWFTGFIPLFAAIWALKHYIHVQKASKNWSIQTNSLPNPPPLAHTPIPSSNPPIPSNNQTPAQNPPNTASSISTTNNQQTSTTNPISEEPTPGLNGWIDRMTDHESLINPTIINQPPTQPIEPNDSSNLAIPPTSETNVSQDVESNLDTLIEQWITEDGHGQIKQFFREKIAISKSVVFVGAEETKNLKIGCRLLNQLPADTIEHLFEVEVKIPNAVDVFMRPCFGSLFEATPKESKEKIISGLLKNHDLANLDDACRQTTYHAILSAIIGSFNNENNSSDKLTHEQLDLLLTFIRGLKNTESQPLKKVLSLIQLPPSTIGSKLSSAFIIGSLRKMLEQRDPLIRGVFYYADGLMFPIISDLKCHLNEEEMQTFKTIFQGTDYLQAIEELLTVST